MKMCFCFAAIACSLIIRVRCLISGAVPANVPSIYTTPVYAPLKGLRKLKVEVKVSRDVKNELEHIGAPAPLLSEELSHLVEKKLKDSGIDNGGSEKGPMLRVLV